MCSSDLQRWVSVLLLSTVVVTGCAPTQRVWVRSEPPGAAVTVRGVQVATTPVLLKLNRTENVTIVLSKDGYEPVAVDLHRSLRGCYLVGFTGGGLLLAGAGYLLKRNADSRSSGPAYSSFTSGLTGTLMLGGAGVAGCGLFSGLIMGDAYRLRPSAVNVILRDQR